MDHRQFDQFSRRMAAATPRRRTMLAALLGLALPFVPATVPFAGAACKKVDQNCDRNRDCCDHAECRSGKCRCKSGFDECSGKCRNLDTDEKFCGVCNVSCRAGDRCCAGTCVDLQFDRDNCGTCGRACDANEECEAGRCRVPAGGCAIGANSCDTTPGNPFPYCGGSQACACRQSTEGVTRCGVLAPSVCGECDQSADCAFLSPLAFCANSDPDCCGPDNKNGCVMPCIMLPNL